MKRIISVAAFTAIALSILGTNAFGQSRTREDVLNEIASKRAELQVLEDQFLAPAKEDRAAYAEFLRQPDTGLIRLVPRDVYESDVYKKNRKTLTIRGGGAYYSFTHLTHEYGYGNDIGLDHGILSVGFAGADYGILTDLGDVPLEEIVLEHPSVSFIAEYSVPTAEPQARLEYRRFLTGTTIDNALYKSTLPAVPGRTYLLRSIGYDVSDVIVAMRLVRKDDDGSVIIAWKLLKKYPKPQLARGETKP
ncbi:MAG: hypothetical protein QOD75_991 [Blastocatellia bacterium]|jgi:hypothetical protein|nr:hypothetical protein [Blastocatellia bacterium]